MTWPYVVILGLSIVGAVVVVYFLIASVALLIAEIRYRSMVRQLKKRGIKRWRVTK